MFLRRGGFEGEEGNGGGGVSFFLFFSFPPPMEVSSFLEVYRKISNAAEF